MGASPHISSSNVLHEWTRARDQRYAELDRTKVESVTVRSCEYCGTAIKDHGCGFKCVQCGTS